MKEGSSHRENETVRVAGIEGEEDYSELHRWRGGRE